MPKKEPRLPKNIKWVSYEEMLRREKEREQKRIKRKKESKNEKR